jgi:hypothetical protein
MFTIDLLKGQGVPMKSSPAGIAIAAVTVVVPLIVAIVMFGFYLSDKTTTLVKKQGIARFQTEIDKLSGAVRMQELLEKEKSVYGDCLSEVKTSVGRYIQWSPVLVTLVENMPDSVMLTNLEVKQSSVRKKVPNKDNPQEMVEKNIPVRVLRLTVRGSSQYNNDKAVSDFRGSLLSSVFLGPKLENVVFSRESEMRDGRDITSYEIDCIFKLRL